MRRSSACWRAGGSMLVVRVTVDATTKIVLTSQTSAMGMSRQTVELVTTWHQVNARAHVHVFLFPALFVFPSVTHHVMVINIDSLP